MKASTKRHSSDSTELEVKTDARSMWMPHAINSEAKKKGGSVLAGNGNPL